ncbi:MAG: flavin oxidoreductase/NADH oxidase [Clostridia bacterium]|nr:flavin oxidoreductase/NADH oxidase [Clostridia bacterium]
MLNHSWKIRKHTLPNRVVFQPMEGCDCNADGSPSDLTVAKYHAAAASGAGMVWFEACAVCPEGRTNPRQMRLTEENKESFRALLAQMREIAARECGIRQVLILQLTHSGRQSIVPMIAYRNSVYETTRPVTDANIVTDDYLDTLPALYLHTALLAKEVGFDGVDVKSCHGYLVQELLSAFSRPGRYGGSLENRSRLYRDCFRAVREGVPSDFLTVTRFSVTDMIPYPNGFGTDENGDMDLTEAEQIVGALAESGLDALNITLGNPYYNPHVNRPFRRGAYRPPESAENGLERFRVAERFFKEKFPDLTVIASGLSYYRDDLIEQSENLLTNGICDLVGFGRMWLAYPMFYRDWCGSSFDPKKCCLACSKCTELMRHHQVSGCAVFNEIYRKIYREKVKI